MKPDKNGINTGTFVSIGLTFALPIAHFLVLCALGTYTYYFGFGRYLDRTNSLLPWVWKHILVDPEYYYSFTRWYPISILAGMLIGVVSFAAFTLNRPKST